MIPVCLITSNVNLNHLIQWRSLTDHLKVILFLLCLLTSIHQWFLLVLVFTSVCIMIFLISSFLLHLLIGIWCKEELSLSPVYLLIQLLVSLWNHGYSFFSVDYNPLLWLFLFLLSWLRFGYWELLQVGSFVLLTWLSDLLSTSLISGSMRLSCIYSAPVLESTITLWKPGFFSCRMVIRNQY